MIHLSRSIVLAVVLTVSTIKSMGNSDAVIEETNNAITHLEKTFYEKVNTLNSDTFSLSLARGACAQIADLMMGKHVPDLMDDKRLSSLQTQELSQEYRKKTVELLAKYYTSEQITNMTLLSSADLREQDTVERLQGLASESEEVRTIAKALLTTKEWLPILNSIRPFSHGVLCFDEKLCNVLTSAEFNAQCQHAASLVIDQIPLKVYAVESWMRAGIYSPQAVTDYTFLLLKKYSLLTAHKVNCALLSHEVLSSVLKHHEKLFEQHEARVTELQVPALSAIFASSKKKVAYYRTEILPSLEQMAAEQEKTQ